MIYYPKKGCVQSHVTSLNFGKCDNILETVQDIDIVTMEKQYEIVCGLSNGTIANALE